MAHFAKVENGIVTQVIVVDEETINAGTFGDPSSWVQTSYNTRSGVHYGADGQPDGGVALRKNFAGIAYIYDKERDAFYSPKPHDSWTLNEETCHWEAPTPMPTDPPENGTMWIWNEETTSWVGA